jgi:hypothetical protein
VSRRNDYLIQIAGELRRIADAAERIADAIDPNPAAAPQPARDSAPADPPPSETRVEIDPITEAPRAILI